MPEGNGVWLGPTSLIPVGSASDGPEWMFVMSSTPGNSSTVPIRLCVGTSASVAKYGTPGTGFAPGFAALPAAMSSVAPLVPSCSGLPVPGLSGPTSDASGTANVFLKSPQPGVPPASLKPASYQWPALTCGFQRRGSELVLIAPPS